MIGVKQKVFGGGNGDCFRACVASILELPNDDRLPNDHSPEWHFTWEKWLGQFGLILDFDAKRIWRETYWIASVKSKNLIESTHAIVMKGAEVAFDPSTKSKYRTGSFLKDDVVYGGWWFEVADVSLLHKLKEYKDSFAVITNDMLDSLLEQRSIKDRLIAQPHPFAHMNDRGYTLFDYVLWKKQKHRRHLSHVLDKVDFALNQGGTIVPEV